MLRINALPFIQATQLLTDLAGKMRDMNDTDTFAPGLMQSIYAQTLDKLIEQLEAMDLRMTLIPARTLKRSLDPTVSKSMVAFYKGPIAEIQSRLRDELATRYMFTMSASSAERFDSTFGVEIGAKFPCLTYEIEEGNKCLALARSTAAAFHFIRCLEAGIKAISTCLGIPAPITGNDRNWGAMLRKIREEVERRWPAATGRSSGDAQFFDQAIAALGSMQNPWRNATMHLDQKYTLEEAEQIMNAVRGFLQKLAARMDEAGLPLA